MFSKNTLKKTQEKHFWCCVPKTKFYLNYKLISFCSYMYLRFRKVVFSLTNVWKLLTDLDKTAQRTLLDLHHQHILRTHWRCLLFIHTRSWRPTPAVNPTLMCSVWGSASHPESVPRSKGPAVHWASLLPHFSTSTCEFAHIIAE